MVGKVNGLDSVTKTLLQAALYTPAPFFGYPWKPFLNSSYGGDYLESYKHFRAQHMDGTNLFYHLLCLVWQLSSNYALLGQLDHFVAPLFGARDKHKHPATNSTSGSVVSLATSVLWTYHLLSTSPTPSLVKLASVVSVLLAHNFLGDFFSKNWEIMVFAQGLALAIVFILLNLTLLLCVCVSRFSRGSCN